MKNFIKIRNSFYGIILFVIFMLGCNNSSNNKLNLQESEAKMNYILSRGDTVTGIYISVYNNLYNDYSGIASAVKEADSIIDELNTFTCTGKFEMRRRNAVKVMTKIRDNLKVALEKGIEQFHIVAQKTEHEYEFFPFIYPMLEDLIYEPKNRLIALSILAAVAIVIFLWKAFF